MSTARNGTKVVLDGVSLTCRTLSHLGLPGAQISVSDHSMSRIRRARQVVDKLVERGFAEGHVAYGINTGFGLFADVIIENDELAKLQRNLIRSHSAGVGEPLTRAETRRLLALRINVLAKGHSGIRCQTVEQMVNAFNKDCLSVVPSQGTVGASGDLAPLSVSAVMSYKGCLWGTLCLLAKGRERKEGNTFSLFACLLALLLFGIFGAHLCEPLATLCRVVSCLLAC